MKLLDFLICWAIIVGLGYFLASAEDSDFKKQVKREGCVVTKVEQGKNGFYTDKDGNTTFVTTPTMMEWTCKDGTTFWK